MGKPQESSKAAVAEHNSNSSSAAHHHPHPCHPPCPYCRRGTTLCRCRPRLPIPVFRNLFLGSKKPFLTGFLRISFYSCVFRRNFSQERGFGEVSGIPFFFLDFAGFFCRNSCGQEILYILRIPPDSSGFLRIPPDSSGFLFPPIAVWLGQRLRKALCRVKY